MNRLIHLALLIALFSLSACGPVTFVVGTSPQDQRLQRKVIHTDEGAFLDRVALIDVSGTIYNAAKSGLLSKGDNPVSLIHEQLEAARHDSRTKAIILRINSPGGTVTASEAVYRDVIRFKKKTGKPVVVQMMDVAASGGYLIACAADHVVAYPTTITGSIGVMMQMISFKPALNRIGVMPESIVSGPNKTAGSPFETLTKPQREILQSMVDDFYAKFVAVVRRHRTDIKEEIFATATDGRIFTGSQALPLGLVDQLGDIHDSFAYAKRAAKLKRAQLVRYHRPLTYVGSPYTHSPVDGADQTQINLLQVNLPEGLADSSVGFYYLWDPTAR